MSDAFDDHVYLGTAIASLKALLPEGLDGLPRDLQRALERDDYSAALAAANRLYASQGPQGRTGALAYAVLLTGRELTSEALGILRRALLLHEQDVPLQLAQAEALLMDGNEEGALGLLEALAAVPLREGRLWVFMGDLYLDMSEVQGALACYAQAMERGHRSADLAFRMGQITVGEEDWQAAAGHFETAARLQSSSAYYWRVAADSLLQIDACERAVYAYRRAVKLEPDDVDLWLRLGLCHQELDDAERAIEAFTQATRLEPMEPRAWLQLGHAQLLGGYPEQALHSFRQCSYCDPQNMDALHGSVSAAFELGDVDLALQLARESVAREPENPEGLFNLGMILLMVRKGPEACEQLERAATLSPDNPMYLGAWALGALMCQDLGLAGDLMARALGAGAEGETLIAYAQELLKQGRLEEARDFVEQSPVVDATWGVVAPLLNLVAQAMLRRDGTALETGFGELREAFGRWPEAIPVLWDFEEVEQLCQRLDRPVRRNLQGVIAVLEGRRDLATLDAMSWSK